MSRRGKGDRHLLPERPFGCFAQKVPVTFSASVEADKRRIFTFLSQGDSR
jgi:hypothetical protein